jgi:hypothetical protein
LTLELNRFKGESLTAIETLSQDDKSDELISALYRNSQQFTADIVSQSKINQLPSVDNVLPIAEAKGKRLCAL